MARIARVLTPEEYAALPWRKAHHRPTSVRLSLIAEPCKIPLVGNQPDLEMQPGEVLAEDDMHAWRIESEEKAERLYEWER